MPHSLPSSPRSIVKRTASLAGLWFVIAAIALLGGFDVLNWRMADWRMATRAQPAGGQTVFVAIDPPSLKDVGIWPWPRSIYATLLNAALDAGANAVFFDIDFSSLSKPAEDAAFSAALDKAGGYAYLAAFDQQLSSGAVLTTVPAAEFMQFADPVAVNVGTDAAGIARLVPSIVQAGAQNLPSLPNVLAGATSAPQQIAIDYGIDASTIPSISAADLINGQVPPGALAGKNIVIGASALELRDVFLTPNQGYLPGAVVQILAAETLDQGRNLGVSGTIVPLAMLAAFFVCAVLFSRQLHLPATFLSVASLVIATETLALLIYHQWAMMVQTAPLTLGLLAYGLIRLASETRIRKFIIDRLTGERDQMRAVLDRVVTDNFDGVVVIGADGKILAASAMAEAWFGTEMAGEPATRMLPPQLLSEIAMALAGSQGGHGRSIKEAVIDLPDGRHYIEFSLVISKPKHSRRANLSRFACLTFRDITDQHAYETHLNYLADHDSLTGALSRPHFIEMLKAQAAASGGKGQAHVLTFKLRRFASVSDTLGHVLGDMLLTEVVRRARALGFDNVARLGSDNFAVFAICPTGARNSGKSLEALVAAICQPYCLNGHRASVGAVGGVAQASTLDLDADALVRAANMALSQAQTRSGNVIEHYRKALSDQLQQRLELETELRNAVESDQFEVAMQPQIRLADGTITGAEALVRWRHPDRGLISPLNFIPIAEETGLIADIGRFVLREACRQAMKWPEHVRVAVNVSPLQFELMDLTAEVEAALKLSGLAAHRLELEITEGVFLDRREIATKVLTGLRTKGIKVAIDDFGTGFSSLSYIGQLPFDILKIDKSFVDRIETDADARAIIDMVISMGLRLKKVVLAEGVETEGQAQILAVMGCEAAQGYFFGKPGPASAIADLSKLQADQLASSGDEAGRTAKRRA